MNNAEIAETLEEIARLLKMKKESIYKIRAYERAADAIRDYPQQLADIDSQDRLKEIPGVGEAISKKLDELLHNGKLEYLENLKRELSGTVDGHA